jgi:hypothetical protein
MGLDHAVEVHIDEVKTWRRPPMAEQPRFNMSEAQWLGQEWIVE